MSEINRLVSEQLQWVVLGFAAVMLLLGVAVIVQGNKLRSMRRRYEVMMSGSGVEDLESLLLDLKNQSDMLEEEQSGQRAAIQAIEQKVRGMKSNVALKRYNAFGERGNDLSFSLAILDDNSSGIVITSLHNREGSFIYSKPMKSGDSQYPLSPEEREVITLALQQT
ncbi:hypothetical protein GCM10010912_45330 [Paenibacillus albidus]|uniref:DUF4446 family protein n=1 Tax=Paenibacillus albidus TaxID=2041023 RepID=A0A917CQW5_9BACL|nr:DUF4446 family protein [Paenibacillus albidus]GGF95315.1 hypothetical protein GCM10010912_45330 [Paenibacillus albidus]